MSTLHVTNGDCAAEIIRRVVADPVVITADVLHEGPAPAVDGDEWYRLRGSFLANGDRAAGDVARQLAASDRRIEDAAHGGVVVLWFEHDLFDQLLLIRTLDLVAGPQSRASLICIDRFPGVDRFVGLGQLSPEQMAALVGSDRPVTPEQYALASAAWQAFRSAEPLALLALVADPARTRALPFLRDALLRFFEEFPSKENGLTRTEALALAALQKGPLAGGALFAATQAEEPRPFIGDSTFFNVVRRLAAGRVPLVSIADGAALVEYDLRPHQIAITEDGRRVLRGERDHIALNGIDLWRGGVHLVGGDRTPWRWDAQRETLVS